jgi:hypothetical protein
MAATSVAERDKNDNRPTRPRSLAAEADATMTLTSAHPDPARVRTQPPLRARLSTLAPAAR